MRKTKFLAFTLIIMMVASLSGCSIINQGLVKLNFRNNDFEYMNESKVEKIIIQNTRDSGFKFIITDTSAINDIYDILSSGSVKSEKTSLDSDYQIEIYVGDEVKTYQYVVSIDENGVGNLYNDDTAYLLSDSLDDIILENLSTIRKPKNFEDIYYNSILDVIELKQEELTATEHSVGIDISSDVDCLKYMFSIDIKEFEASLNELIPGAELIGSDSSSYDTIITVKNRGYSTKVFKTAITVDNKKDKSYETYYVTGTYEYKTWDITVSEANEKPSDW